MEAPRKGHEKEIRCALRACEQISFLGESPSRNGVPEPFSKREWPQFGITSQALSRGEGSPLWTDIALLSNFDGLPTTNGRFFPSRHGESVHGVASRQSPQATRLSPEASR